MLHRDRDAKQTYQDLVKVNITIYSVQEKVSTIYGSLKDLMTKKNVNVIVTMKLLPFSTI